MTAPTSKNVSKQGMFIWNDTSKQYEAWDGEVSATLASLPAGTNLIGKVGIDQVTANANEVVVKSITAGSNIIGNIRIDQTTPGTTNRVDIGAALPAGTNAIGKLAANSGVDIGDVDVTSLPMAIQGPGNPNVASFAHIAINLTTGNNQVLVASAANRQIWVYGYAYTVGTAAVTMSFQDEDDTAVTGIPPHAQYGGFSVSPSGNFAMPIWKLATDKDLECDITGGDVDGWLCYALVIV